MDANTLIVGILIGCGTCGALGAYVAEQKGRKGGEGFALGLLLGPLGVLVAALMPPPKAGGVPWHGFTPKAPHVPRWQKPLKPL